MLAGWPADSPPAGVSAMEQMAALSLWLTRRLRRQERARAARDADGFRLRAAAVAGAATRRRRCGRGARSDPPRAERGRGRLAQWRSKG